MTWLTDVKKRLKKATPGPWNIWDGPAYAGGGKDLCIGAGNTWLANMDHRFGVNYQGRVDHDVEVCASKKGKGKLKDHEADVCDICSISAKVTREQRANAELIASAPIDLERAIEEIEYLVAGLKAAREISSDRQRFVMQGAMAWGQADRILADTLACHETRIANQPTKPKRKAGGKKKT